MKAIRIALIVLLAGIWNSVFAESIVGAGSTFVQPIITQWAAAYKKATGNEVNYQGIGSGGGISQIKARTVNFAATDKPLTLAELSQAKLRQFPVVVGGIVLITNIKGVTKPITLDGTTIAQIYLGNIKFWDDPAIVALNKADKTLALPHQAITVVYRSDGSGTTYNFTYYLSAVDPMFAKKIGTDTVVAWKNGIGAKGNAGIANYLQKVSGSIGYVEYAYAKQNKLTTAYLLNANGQALSPSLASFSAAAEHAQWDANNGFYQILTNQSGKNSWPITASTFILLPEKTPENAAKVAVSENFFRYCFLQGQDMAKRLDYVPIPTAVYTKILKTFDTKK